jgi:hypothetical protein
MLNESRFSHQVLVAMQIINENPLPILKIEGSKGGGRKPWRQKGTGRARRRSIRSQFG